MDSLSVFHYFERMLWRLFQLAVTFIVAAGLMYIVGPEKTNPTVVVVSGGFAAYGATILLARLLTRLFR